MLQQGSMKQGLLNHALGRRHRSFRAARQYERSIRQRTEFRIRERGQAEEVRVTALAQRLIQLNHLGRSA